MLFLKRNAGVRQEIAHVDGVAQTFNIGVLLTQQPSNVGEEEPALDVGMVGVRLGKLVVQTVDLGPVEDWELVGGLKLLKPLTVYMQNI